MRDRRGFWRAAGSWFLVPAFAQKITPDLPGTHHTFVGVILPAIAEISMLVYLLVIGVKASKPAARRAALAAID